MSKIGYDRDVAGKLTGITYGTKWMTPILRHDLGWDAAGQLVWTKKIPDALFDERYGLDKQGQLTEWKLGVLNAANEILAPADSLGWNLDSRGNWTNVYDSKKTVDTRAHSGANAITSRNNVTFAYDAAGNLLSDGVHAYEWTLDGLLAKVSSGLDTVVYLYDGQRRLVSRTAKIAGVNNADAYVWDGWQLAQEYRSGTANTYAYGNYIDDRIATKNGSGTCYFHRSYNQTTEAVTDATGELVERYTATSPYGGYVIQDASGNVLTVSSIGNRSVFQGAPMAEPVSGLVYLRNRWYSPEMGRFVSRDPAKDGWNWYEIVSNKVNFYVDPFGLNIYAPYVNDRKGLEGGFFLFGGVTIGISVQETRKLCCDDLSKYSRTLDITAHIGFGSGLGGSIETPIGSLEAQSIGNFLDFSFNFTISQSCGGKSSSSKCFDVSWMNGNTTSMSLLFGRDETKRDYETLKICFETEGGSVRAKKLRCSGTRKESVNTRPFPLVDSVVRQDNSENCEEVP